MAQPTVQASFNSGEWAPALNARVDLQKYHSGAALLRNFFVDYRGGASTRPGTKWILQAYKSATDVRVIGFQASTSLSYVLEFGDQYLRFYSNGSPILEATKSITAVTKANPGVWTVTAHGYSVGEWIFVSGVSGMTQINNRYFIINTTPSANTFTVKDLFGVPLNTIGFGTFTGTASARRVYTITTPYLAADLALLKFVFNVNNMTITHADYPASVLTLITPTNWTLIPIAYGTAIPAPTGVAVATTLGAGTWHYSYVVTAVDVNGQESTASSSGVIGPIADLRLATGGGTNRITWNAVSGARSYNVYKAELSDANAVPAGAAFGYIGNATGVTFDDSNIAPDFSIGTPIAKNPFQGAGVESATITAAGTYTTVPTATFSAAPAGGATATGSPYLSVTGTPTVGVGGAGYAVGDAVFFRFGVILIVATIGGGGSVTAFQPITFPGSSGGVVASGATPANPEGDTGTSGGGGGVTANFVWGVGGIVITNQGTGYTAAPTITFSAGAATATAVLASASAGNPLVPGYFQQRLVLAGQAESPQSFNMSQPGLFYNFDISDPIQPDDAISGVLVSRQLNSIKSLIGMPAGLIVLSDRAVWMINGGANNDPVTPANIVASENSYVGASDVPPIVANADILYVQARGSVIRNAQYNFNSNIFTGADISVLSSHLFYGFTILEWAWAEEPFKLVWAVRDDGDMLTLTFLKEQEMIAWAHSDTDGLFKSVCTVSEAVGDTTVDAVYTVVERTIKGQTLKYIERFAERIFPNGAADAWFVDAGLQYSGAPATSFTGAEHLAGETVTGLADGVPITPFVMPANGAFNLSPAKSKVTVGLPFTPQLQTLALDLGEPTVQSKRKTIPAVTVRCQETLGLKIGKTFSTLVAMKDLVLGNVGSATNTAVAGLVTADARTLLDPSWTEPGQYCIEQPLPLPATILGVFPEIAVGDTKGEAK